MSEQEKNLLLFRINHKSKNSLMYMQETKIGEIDHIIGEMKSYLLTESKSFSSLDSIEGGLFEQLLALGQVLLSHYIELVESQLCSTKDL